MRISLSKRDSIYFRMVARVVHRIENEDTDGTDEILLTSYLILADELGNVVQSCLRRGVIGT